MPSTETPTRPKGPRLQISATQLIASALAAVTATIAASYLGVSGTVIGAAIASVVTVTGNAVYGHSLHRTSERVRTAVPTTARWLPPSKHDADEEPPAETPQPGSPLHAPARDRVGGGLRRRARRGDQRRTRRRPPAQRSVARQVRPGHHRLRHVEPDTEHANAAHADGDPDRRPEGRCDNAHRDADRAAGHQVRDPDSHAIDPAVDDATADHATNQSSPTRVVAVRRTPQAPPVP